jgi:hypothetical protein
MSGLIIGQNIELMLVVGGEPKTTLTDIKSCEFTLNFEKKTEQHLGQTSAQHDEVYVGVDGKLEFNYSDKEPFKLAQAVLERAKRRGPGDKVNLKLTATFPDGNTVKTIIPDIVFGPMPFGFPGRTEYAHFSIDFSARECRFLF